MRQNMMDVIEYIRSWFVPSRNKRKRSTSDLIHEIKSPSKYRKLSHFPEDDWIKPSVRATNKAAQMERITCKPSVIVLDDEGEVTIPRCNGARPKAPISSTPNYNLSKFRLDLNSSTNSAYFTPKLNSKDLLTSVKKSGVAMSGTTADYAFRLDEKQKYQQLLYKSGSNSSGLFAESFANYYTPLGKSQNIRSRFLNDLSKNASGFVDLTNSDGNHERTSMGKNKTATSETILKVLDDFDDAVVVKDSDSDVEILPTPPSPKPDFKIERVNSLKQLAESCEPLQASWIGNKALKHQQEVEKVSLELLKIQNHLLACRKINEENFRMQLEKQVEKCLHIKEVVLPIEEKTELPELTPKQQQMVNCALEKRASQSAVLISKFNLNITRRDMLTLAGLNWLNDEVINFYMNLLIERGKLAKYPNTYGFNTFFYPKILKDGQQSVRRWTRRVDVFAHDIICVPIHLGMHWCMAIVDTRAKTVCYYDSMGKPNSQCTEAIFKYLQDEHADKKGVPMDTKGWQLKSVRDVPQQMNGSDCGMFSCTYAEFASRNAPFTFSQEDMPYLRRKMVVEILTGQLLIQ